MVLLADEFYFVAHDDTTGKPRLHTRAAGLGLACGLLTELLFADRISVRSGQLTILDRQPPEDALAHTTLDQLIAEQQHRAVRTWLMFLSHTAAESVAQRLVRGGHLRTQQVRRAFRTTTAYVPTNMSAAAWPENRLRMLLNSGRPVTLGDAALAGLAAATGLSDRILVDVNAEGRGYHKHILASLPAPLRELFSHTEAAVGDAVLTNRP